MLATTIAVVALVASIAALWCAFALTARMHLLEMSRGK